MLDLNTEDESTARMCIGKAIGGDHNVVSNGRRKVVRSYGSQGGG